MEYKKQLIILWVCALVLVILLFAALKTNADVLACETSSQETRAEAEESEEQGNENIIFVDSRNRYGITDEYIAEVMAWEHPHVEEATEIVEETPIRYPLTDEERAEIEQVVMAECGAEPYEGIMAVAQCILNACETSQIRPLEAVKVYSYTPTRKSPSESVIQAVEAVFDKGETVTDENILFFYAWKYGNGGWHETQKFVMEIGGHRFFTLND